MANQKVIEKDKTEEQLEKILFGNSEGYLTGLQKAADENEEVNEDEGDLDGVADENVTNQSFEQG